MSELKWTLEQQKVIALRDRNILVAAAAGSGKTAVLVERILGLITDKERGLDVDRLLVVTFTKAAAAEMRERISRAVEERLSSDPDNLHLQKQGTLLHHANISTIDSFCKKVIQDHFHEIDLDPGFRVADEAEMLLLKSDVMEKLLEDYYEKGEEEFLDFVECYAAGRTDAALEEVILQLFRFAESNPHPQGWLLEKKKDYERAPEESEWMGKLMVYLGLEIESLYSIWREAEGLCAAPGGPYHYGGALAEDGLLLQKLMRAGTYGEYDGLLDGYRFAALSRKRPKDVDDEAKEQVKVLRDQVKKGITEIRETFFFQPEAAMWEDIRKSGACLSMMLQLAGEFLTRFREEKQKKNLVDFSDLEHMALAILRGKDGEATEAAAEYREYFEEILIDEYQDSNLIQEQILTGISREVLGRPNVFMVGDVKQSIYKFRLARPELFMEKYGKYTKEDSLYQKIDLHQNFRSRAEVLEGANAIFEAVMGSRLGGVEYDEDARLNPGAGYLEQPGADWKSEVLLLDRDEAVQGEDGPAGETGSKEMEAQMAAARIRELVRAEGGQLVTDRDEEGKPLLRTAEYRDIVILLRTMSGWSEVFVRELAAAGIPAAAEVGTGYFSAWEVQLLLHFLRILDNPRQDIPLAAVLFSPIVGLTAEEMALLRIRKKRADLWEALEAAVQTDEEGGGLRGKLAGFLVLYGQMRDRLPYTQVHELLQLIFQATGIYHYAAAMPGGRRRAANLDMLLQKALEFEKTSYHGLFHFVRYIEKLHKYEVDFGEAPVSGAKENMVRIYSVHKSKGLEFPIVLVCGLGKPFNRQDSRSRLVIHPVLGIGADYIDAGLRTRIPTLLKRVIQKQLLVDNIGEELRVLYVALTRAKEKLILTGTVKKLPEKLGRWRGTPREGGKKLPFHSLLKAANALDLLMPVICGSTEWFEVKQEDAFSLTGREVLQQVEKQLELGELLKPEGKEKDAAEDGGETGQGDKPPGSGEGLTVSEIQRELSYRYPYQLLGRMKGKVTVSELKKLHLEEEEAGEAMFQERDNKDMEHVVPGFMKEEAAMAGNVRGTLYHSVMENMDLAQVQTAADVREALAGMTAERRITEEERQQLDVRKLGVFVESGLAERMRTAQKAGKLHKESPFVLGIPAGELYPELAGKTDSAADTSLKEQAYQLPGREACRGAQAGADINEELVLVQGIIDVYFEEEDGLVLVDYKTDAVGPDGAGVLARRYRVQLDYYSQALERLTGKKVKERSLYSFALGAAVPV